MDDFEFLWKEQLRYESEVVDNPPCLEDDFKSFARKMYKIAEKMEKRAYDDGFNDARFSDLGDSVSTR